MKKVAIVFILAVFVPSLTLAWLAVRTLRDQQIVLRNKQALLYQTVADSMVKEVDGYFASQQRDFGQQVESLLAREKITEVASSFDNRLRPLWPLAEVGFSVALDGTVLSPSPLGRPEARSFRLENDKFLCSRESVEVYWNGAKGPINLSQLDEKNSAGNNLKNDVQNPNADGGKNSYSTKNQNQQIARSVVPQQPLAQKEAADAQQFSKVSVSEAEFRQLVGDSNEGTLARVLQNKMHLMIWYRPPRDRRYVFGAQLDKKRLIQDLQSVVSQVETPLREEICAALLDDAGRPAALSVPGFQTDWKHPFVASEIGEILPHWETAIYLLHPERLSQSAAALRLTLSLLIAVLLLAIGVGGALIVMDLNRQLALARQKTDFVSNVSHELKTPLTSIRMFSELLAEERVEDREKQKNYLNIITAEAARLTRLINNVLDFSRMERGEKKYHFQKCDLAAVTRETVESYRPQLEANGFNLETALPETPVHVNGEADALSQIVVNLLSNAEKYSLERKEITVELERKEQPLPHVELRVLDRGPGVPAGSEKKIFEQFYRAHDSLSSGIQGSGLGLTLARQIARAHGGDLTFRRRGREGGSCFVLRLPVSI